MCPGGREDAVSPVQGALLMVAVVVILAAIIMALLMGMVPRLCDPFPEAIVQVVGVHDYSEAGTVLNYDSRLLLRNMGPGPLSNRPLTANFYCDGVRVDCVLRTFHGEDFIPTHHFGIERIQGEGCRGETWEPGASVLIDFTDRTFMPGKAIRVDIVDRGAGCVVSRHTFTRGPGPAR